MCELGGEWKRDTRVCSKQEHRKFVSILRGNPRNPRINIHGPPCLSLSLSPSFSSKLYSSLRLLPMHLSPHSPEFLFYSLLSINVFSFPRSQNFLIISAKMRDSLSRTEYDSIDFLFFCCLEYKETIPGIDPDRLANPIYAASGYFYFPIAFRIWSYFSFIARLSLFSLLVHRILNGIALRFRIFNIQRLIIEKLRGNYRIA